VGGAPRSHTRCFKPPTRSWSPHVILVNGRVSPSDWPTRASVDLYHLLLEISTSVLWANVVETDEAFTRASAALEALDAAGGGEKKPDRARLAWDQFPHDWVRSALPYGAALLRWRPQPVDVRSGDPWPPRPPDVAEPHCFCSVGFSG